MRTLLICLCLLVLAYSVGLSQDKVDVIYLKNGDVRKGSIIENVPNDYVKIETSDGSIFTVKYTDIKKMTKESKSESQQSAPTPATRGNLMTRTSEFGITAGLWLSGDVRVASPGFDLTKNTGLLLRIFYDAFVAEKFGVGAYANFSPISVEGSDEGATLIEFGGSLKPRFPLGDGNVVLKPGLNIGYRMISSNIPAADKINALGLNVSVEIQFASKAGVVPFAEVGFLAQPARGNSNSDITFAPIIYLGGGIVF
jgi:hypothetical protein